MKYSVICCTVFAKKESFGFQQKINFQYLLCVDKIFGNDAKRGWSMIGVND